MKTLQYCCVNVDNQELEELEHLIETAKDISFDTFRRNVGSNELRELTAYFGYKTINGCGLSLANDYAVRFCSAKTPDGKRAYMLVQSGIEYVFY